MFELNTYVGVVQKAIIIENEGAQARKERENRKRKAGTTEIGQGQGSSQGRFERKPNFH